LEVAGGNKEGEGGETVGCALMAASYTPRGHPVPIHRQCTCGGGYGLLVYVQFAIHGERWDDLRDVTICHDHVSLTPLALGPRAPVLSQQHYFLFSPTTTAAIRMSTAPPIFQEQSQASDGFRNGEPRPPADQVACKCLFDWSSHHRWR